MEYEKSYLFEPEDVRPAKKRKMEPQGLQASWKLRQKIYREAWRHQKEQIDFHLQTINAKTVTGLKAFLDDAGLVAESKEISTAIVSTGAEASSIRSVIDQLSQYQAEGFRRSFITLAPSDGANLKALLKAIIQKATSRSEGVDDEEMETTSGALKRNKLLNYDLQILADHVNSQKIQQVAIAVYDVEAFGGDLLSDLIETLGCWQDRINFRFIFCVATSVDFLEQRLSREALQCLSGSTFDVAPLSVEVEKVFHALIDDEPHVWIGPSLMAMLLERQNDYIQSIESMVDEVQYAYMSCFYANALSLFLDENIRHKDVPGDHYDALRNLPSFRSWCRQLLEEKETKTLTDVLDNNSSLHEEVIQEVQLGREKLSNLSQAAKLVHRLQELTPGTPVTPTSRLYIQAMSNKLGNSSLIRTLLLTIRKAPSNLALEILDHSLLNTLPSPYNHQFTQLGNKLRSMIQGQNSSAQPMRSSDDVQNSTLRTTIVAQKVELSMQKFALSKQDQAYTTLLRAFTDLLKEYFEAHLVDPKSLPFHEIFLYDLRSPHREVFTPRPRHAIERALAAPHDYLDCECCGPGEEASLSASQPATAVLYQLYLESGGLINVSDLWQAFQAVVGEDEGMSDEGKMAIFQRGLAELRYLGLVKGTRKRVDHVAKVSWRGL